MDRRLVHRLRSERGTTLVEVIAAAVILVVIAGAITSLVSAAQRESGQSRVIAIAGDLAQSELEGLRAKKFSQLVGLNETAAVTAGGLAFTVKRSSAWASEASHAPVGCSATANTPEALQVKISVEWASMTRRPVALDTLVAAPVSEETKGNYVVQINDRNGEGVGGVPVTMNGTTTATGATDSTGCVRFTDLEQGQYTLTFQKAGYVDRTHTNVVTAPVAVNGGETASKGFDYDQGAGVDLQFVSQTAPGITAPIAVPGVMLKNAGVPTVPGTMATGNTTATHSKLLWPATSQYEVHADTCDANTAVGGVGVTPGMTTPPRVNVMMPWLQLQMDLPASNVVAGSARARFVTPCGTVLTNITGTIPSGTTWRSAATAMPPGTMASVCVFWKQTNDRWYWVRSLNQPASMADTVGRTITLTRPASPPNNTNANNVCTS